MEQKNWANRNLIRGLVVRNSVRIANINGTVGRNRTEEGSNNSLGLVRASNIAIADIEDHQRMNLH